MEILRTTVAFVSLKFREEGQAGEIHCKLLIWKWNLNLGREEGRWSIGWEVSPGPCQHLEIKTERNKERRL